MASFGDNYTYSVQFDASGVGEVQQATAAVKGLGQAAKQSAADVRQSSGMIAAAGNRMGQGLAQVTYIMDDMAYGARGLRNQILPLSTAMLGFGPAGAIVGAAGTVLVGVFGKQIDAALAYAGVLDENLVKGMENAGEGTDAFAEKVDALKGVLADAGDEAKQFLEALRSENLQGGTLDAALVSLVALKSPMQNALRAAQGEVAAVEAEMQALVERGKQGQDVFAQIADASARLDRARDAVEAVQDEMAQFVAGGVQTLKDGLAQGGDAAQRVLDQLDAIPDKSPEVVRATKAIKDALNQIKADQFAKMRQEADEFADAILQNEEDIQQAQNERFAAGEALRQEEVRQILEVHRIEAEAAQARAAQRRQERQAEARGRLDAQAAGIHDAFAPMLQGDAEAAMRARVAAGMPVDRARMEVFAALQERMAAAGMEGGATDAALGQIVDEIGAMIQGQANGFEAFYRMMMSQLQRGTMMQRQMDIRMREAFRMQILQGNPVNGRF